MGYGDPAYGYVCENDALFTYGMAIIIAPKYAFLSLRNSYTCSLLSQPLANEPWQFIDVDFKFLHEVEKSRWKCLPLLVVRGLLYPLKHSHVCVAEVRTEVMIDQHVSVYFFLYYTRS